MIRSSLQKHKRPIFDQIEPITLNDSLSMTENYNMPLETNIATHRVVLVKGDQKWRFEWAHGQELSTVKAITEIAKSPDQDFDWFDAAMVCHEISKVTTAGGLDRSWNTK